MQKKIIKLVIILVAAILIVTAYQLGFADFLTFSFVKDHVSNIERLVENDPVPMTILYFLLYVFTTAVSFPGATVLTLLGGAVFGTLKGVLLVSFASTMGATIAFWASRFLFKDIVAKKFDAKLQTINDNINRLGPYYLLSLRLIPVFPFFLVNLLMGITSMKTRVFFIMSQLGMLPATFIFVLAGKRLSQINSLRDILSFKIISMLVFLGLIPYLAKFAVSFIKNKRLYRKFTRPASFDYNLIVIGGGSGGLVASYIAAAVKSKVALIEKHKMGGDCLNYGCVPSKALIKTAKTIHLQHCAKELGLKEIKIEFDFLDVMKRVKRVIREISPHDSVERYRGLGVDCLTGNARIISPFEVEVNGRVYTTLNIVIATGARANIPPIPGIENANYITSETLWDLQILPKRLLVLGGGAIGVEMAQCFNRLGSEVTIIEDGPRLLSKEDTEVSVIIEKKFLAEGIKIATGHRAEFFEKSGSSNILQCSHGGKKIRFEYDQVLLATGRKANVTGFGLEELGILIRKNGTIDTNEFMETNLPNILACGDVTGPYQLTHTASYQAWFCAVNGLFGKFKKFKIAYDCIPWCTFSDPEVATVGLNEIQAIKEKRDYEVTLFQLDDLDRAIADSDTAGFVKVITQKGSDKILGATIVGSQASTMILEFITAIKFNIGLKKIMNTIHIYPTMGEANKYAAGVWRKNHTPQNVLHIAEKYFKWVRR